MPCGKFIGGMFMDPGPRPPICPPIMCCGTPIGCCCCGCDCAAFAYFDGRAG
jgi:hypothetical protein